MFDAPPLTAKEECEAALTAAIAIHDGKPSLAERRLEIALYAMKMLLKETQFQIARHRVEQILKEIERLT